MSKKTKVLKFIQVSSKYLACLNSVVQNGSSPDDLCEEMVLFNSLGLGELGDPLSEKRMMRLTLQKINFLFLEMKSTVDNIAKIYSNLENDLK